MSESTCSIEGCDKRAAKRGWCNMHYLRWRRHGDPLLGALPPRRYCTIDGCERVHFGRGLCNWHYVRWYRHGDPVVIPPRKAGGNSIRHGATNATWVGDDATYMTVHSRLRFTRGTARSFICTCGCGAQADEWAYDHLDQNERVELINGHSVAYSTDLAHYVPMARSCHRKLDRSTVVDAEIARP